MTLPAFQYEKLQDPANNIRLLSLLERDKSTTCPDHIRCELTTWDITHVPDYTAVSYTWGAPDQESTIILNGKAFAVRPNCLYLLQQAQEHGVTGYFWIDAICINQLDDQEKSVQVAMMGDIYRHAGCTNVCIGPHGDDSHYLFKAIEEHMRWATRVVGDAYTSGRLQAGSLRLKEREKWSIEQIISQLLLPGPSPQKLIIWPRWVSYETQLPAAFSGHSIEQIKRLWEAIYALFKRPYFERLWIIQELVLSRTAVVLCGNSSIAFDAIKEFESNLYRYCEDNKLWAEEHIPYHRHETLETISDFVRKYRDMDEVGFDLGELTDRTSDFKCFDPRDRVFGIFSLVDERASKSMRPDYTKSKLEVALQAIEHICGIADGDTDLEGAADDDPWPKWPIVSATKIAMALGLTSSDADIDTLLQQRRLHNDPPRTPSPNTMSNPPDRKIQVSVDYCSQLFPDAKSRKLTSCLTRRNNRHLALNERQIQLIQARDQARDSPSQNAAFRTLTTSGGHLCAKIPSNAQAGDLILSFQQTNAFNVGLLVRNTAIEDDMRRLQIIGQVIFEDETGLCPGGLDCVCKLPEEAHEIAEEDVRVLFDALDLLLFVCQSLRVDAGTSVGEYEQFQTWDAMSDMPLSERDQSDEEIYEDVGDGVRRLETSVTAPGNVWSSYMERGG